MTMTKKMTNALNYLKRKGDTRRCSMNDFAIACMWDYSLTVNQIIEIVNRYNKYAEKNYLEEVTVSDFNIYA